MKVVVIASLAESLVNFRGPLLAAMKAGGHDVVACAPDEDAGILDQLGRLGVRFRAITMSRTSMNPFRDLGCFVSLLRLFREERPDVTLAYTAKPVIYGSLAAVVARVPAAFSIITGLGYAFTGLEMRRRWLSRGMGLLYRCALAFNKAVFFQNPDDLELFRRRKFVPLGCPAVVVGGSGVDLDRFPEVPPVLQPISFLLIARLLRDKGVAEFADAAREVKRRYPEVVFDLVGPFDSNPSNLSEAEVAAWQAEGILRYHGRVSDVRPFIAAASVYVLPSYREGVPRTVLEAMAMGRAVITTDAPGCRETVIPGENGFLVPIKNARALASAMGKFIQEPDLIQSMGRRSHELAACKFDVRSVNTTILETMGLTKRQAN
ncbi:MAG: glycosyltransferase family 4 protein [Verrucomicrobia bacterium]|nr:glycosyltransferase family 4 protein [Verrucomicrobiota bacterium]